VFDGSPVKNLSSGGGSAALIHQHKPQCLLSVCKRPIFFDFWCLAVSCRWQEDLPRHFILMCLLGVSVLCYHFFFHLTICVAKWTIDLQALFVAHTRHVVLLPIQPHFCVVLIHSPCEGSRDVQNVPIMRRRPSAVDSFKIARATQATLVMMVDTVQRV